METKDIQGIPTLVTQLRGYKRYAASYGLGTVQLCCSGIRRESGVINVLRNRFSVPSGNFQLMTVAPYFRILTEAPEGCLIVTESSVFSIAMGPYTEME
jgi:hypothetical protein